MKEKAKKILTDLFKMDAFNEFVSLNIMLLVQMIVVRLFSYLEFYFRLDVGADIIKHISTGIVYDLALLCHIIAWSAIPFVVLYRFIPRVTKGLYIFAQMIYVILSALLIEYFCNLSKPLDHIIYMYSNEEISNIIFSSVNITATPILFFISILAVSTAICILWRKIKINGIASITICILALITSIFVNYRDIIQSESLYKSHTDYCYATNQISYSYIKIADYEQEITLDINMTNIKDAAKTYQSQFPQNTYTNYEYPYNHYFSDKDAIGKLLNKTSNSELPNFVFIIIEGFGRKLTGVDKPSVSFTPFLDSLANTGLLWENCLSTAERTFEVLPSIFASAPYGTHGFANKYYPIPYHNSILQDFSKNGYTTSFYYGGSSSFDGQNEFMEANNVSYIMKAELDTSNAEQYAAMKKGNRWGLDDGDMFRSAIQHKQKDNTKPFVDIYLTLTTHEPFICPNIEEYEKKVDKIVNTSKISTQKELDNIEGNKNIFACYLYTDNCIRELVSEYKKMNAYNNTIFVICGDHRMCPLGSWNQLQKYHIPLIIHSNLVKSPRRMKAVVSHLDIAPTLNAYLSENFESYRIEKECQWMGTSLDTAKDFRCRKRMPFILNNRDIEEYINDTLFITYDNLFSVHENLTVTQIENDQLLQMMKNKLEAEKTISKYAVYYNCLKPINSSKDELIYNFASNLENKTALDEEIVDDNGNKVIHLDSNKEFGSICKPFNLDGQYKSLNISAKFNFKNLSDKPMPIFVVSIEKDGKFILYKTRTLLHEKDTEKSGWMIFNDRENIQINDDCDGAIMKIYLWNKDKGDIMYDNINVSVYEAR